MSTVEILAQASPQGEAFSEPSLDCKVDSRRIAIPLSYVDQLVQYERSPLPLASPFVGGLGIYEGTLVISLTLHATQRLGLATTKGVLLRTQGITRWAIEVDETYSFVDVIRHEGASHPGRQPWILPGSTPEGRSLECLNVDRLLSTFRSTSRA